MKECKGVRTFCAGGLCDETNGCFQPLVTEEGEALEALKIAYEQCKEKLEAEKVKVEKLKGVLKEISGRIEAGGCTCPLCVRRTLAIITTALKEIEDDLVARVIKTGFKP